VDPIVSVDLGMERGGHQVAGSNRDDPTHRLTGRDRGQGLDAGAHPLDPRGADEDRVHGGVEAVELERALEGLDLARPPSVSCPGAPSSMWSASMIIPAQVPNVGMPAWIRSRSGSKSSNVRASLAMVVDSPPGRISPSQASSSAGRRTPIARTPRSVSIRRCSRTSPCRAKTPMVGEDTGSA
jgi:hypothetical protein